MRSKTLLLVALLLLALNTGPTLGFTSASEPMSGTEASALSTITLNAVSDASIDRVASSATLGNQQTLEVQYLSSRQVRRTLLRFNLAAALPSDAVIDSARLELFLEGSQGASSVPFTASRVLQDWVESQVTWNNRPSTGAPYAYGSIGSGSGYKSLDVTEIARAWHNAPHYGLELRGPEDESVIYSRVFESREHGEMRPRLVVTYHQPAPTYTLSGRVYAGAVGDESSPLGGVAMELYGSNDAGTLGLRLTQTTTDASGWYGLPVSGNYEFYHILEVDPPGYESVNATTVDGVVIDPNHIQYATPLAGKTLTGNRFWDRRPVTTAPTRTPTATTTGVPTATRTATGLPTASPTTRATQTPTLLPTPTTTLPPDCVELLVNGGFESGSLAPWWQAGAVGLGSGQDTAYGVWMGGADSVAGEMGQMIDVPAGSQPVRLRFAWRAESPIEQPDDVLEVLLQYGEEQVDHLRTLRAVAPLNQWRFEEVDMTAYAGQAVGLTFFVHTDGEVPSTFRVDDVSVVACGAPAVTPTATQTLTPVVRTPTPTVTGTPRATPSPTSTREGPRTWAVNSTADDDDGACQPLGQGDCTLREALLWAAELGGPDHIVFDIPHEDPGFIEGQWIIQPRSPLPFVVDPSTTIDGQHPRVCGPDVLIVLDGSNAPAGSHGLVLTGSLQTVRGLVIRNWPGSGVSISGGESCQVSCNHIVQNGQHGVHLAPGSHHNLIGWQGEGNVVAGNEGSGVLIEGAGSDSNRVLSNYIGTDPPGQTPWANGGHGVWLRAGAQYNEVGGELGWHGNVISGNGMSGVMIEGNNTDINRVGANLIGIAADGVTPLGNGHHGVGIYGGAVLNQVGSSVLLPNTIAANGWSGVAIVQSNTNGVVENHIGSDASAELDLGNGWYGVHVVGAKDNVISSNTIAHNGADGVRIEGTGTVQNPITVNAITANAGKGIELLDGGNTELAAPVITQVTANSVQGTACANCTVEVFSDAADQGRFVHSPPYAFADASGNWQWNGTLSGANVTATATDGNLNTSEFSAPVPAAPLMLKRDFAGQVNLIELGGQVRPLGAAQVSLHASEERLQLGELLASTYTERDGSFLISLQNTSEVDLPYYFLQLSDPNLDVVDADAGAGGEVMGESWIRFERPDAGRIGDNHFDARRREGDPVPKEPPAIVPLGNPPAPPPEPSPPAPVDFYIQGVEVTQAIQCFDTSQGYTKCPNNSLELSAGKATAVRVYVGCTGCSGSSIKVAVRAVRAYCTLGTPQMPGGCAAWSGPSSLQYFNAPLNKSIAALRPTLSGSANWFLSTSPNEVQLALYVSVNLESQGQHPETNFNNNTAWMQLPLHKRAPFNVKWVLIEYNPAPSKTYSPYPKGQTASAAVVGKSAWMMKSAFPMPVTYSQISPPIKYTGVDVRDDDASLLLAYLSYRAQKEPNADSVFGWLPPGATAGANFAGQAASWYDKYKQITHRFGFGDQSNDGNPIILAHEIGHNNGLNHPLEDSSWLYPNNVDIKETGLDVGKKALYPATADDFMDTPVSDGDWISPYHWMRLVGKTMTKSAGGALTGVPQPAILVRGRLYGDGSGELDPCYQMLDEGPFPTSESGAEHCIDLRDSAGTVLASHCFEPFRGYVSGSAPSDTGLFSLMLALPEGTSRVVLRRGPSVLAERSASPHAPQVTVLSPQQGALIDGQTTLSWSASDADQDPLSYALFYSRDGGASWAPFALDATVPEVEVDTSLWAGASEAHIRVLASDGFHTAAADSPWFSVPRKDPLVLIQAPHSGAVLHPEQAIVLSGHAEDLEDGELEPSALEWASDRQGVLGHGPELYLPGIWLEPGRHIITLTAIDSDEQTGSASVSVYVGYGQYLPLIVRGAD